MKINNREVSKSEIDELQRRLFFEKRMETSKFQLINTIKLQNSIDIEDIYNALK